MLSACVAVVVAWYLSLPSVSAVPQEVLLPPAPGMILHPEDNVMTAFEAIENANKDEANLRIVDSIRGELYQGDIQLTNNQRRILGLLSDRASRGGRQRRGAMASLSRRWVKSNGQPEIPYQIESSVGHARSVIQAGIRHWMEKVPCLKFVQKARHHTNYVSFFAGGGCYSMVGRIGGGQKISIGRGCEYLHTVVHEIGHALGFWHEQARPDRDRYITIYWNNIPQRYRSQFTKMSSGAINSRGVSYDYDSVMHYHSTAFGGGRTTITRKDGSRKLGNTRGLSPKDIQQANLMYCNRLPTNKPATAKPPTGCRHRDYHRDCPIWANNGYCRQKYQIYMMKNCKASCLCKDNASCTDRKQYCAVWVRRGFCTGIYKAFMSTNCKKSCHQC